MSAELYWLAQTQAAVPSGDHWLSEWEYGILGALRIPKRRAEWRLGRWTAKLAIAACAGLPSDIDALPAIELRPAASGAPQAFFGGRPAAFAISLSHSHGVGFCTVAGAGTKLGCDIEAAAPHSPAFEADYFTPEEQQLVQDTPAFWRPTVLTLLWSAKESVLKALECGLRRDLRSVCALPEETLAGNPARWRPLVANCGSDSMFRGWWRATGDYVWTVMARPAPSQPLRVAPHSDP